MDEFDLPAGKAGKFYNKALKFLSYRPRSEHEVVKNLLKKKLPEDLIRKIITRLKEYKFLDDEEFTKWWIEQRTNFKPRSLRLIKIELKQKGISNELIEHAIESLQLTISSDLESARKLIERKKEKWKNLTREKKFQKVARHLASKGFNYDIIKEIFKEIS
ncbi:MAG: RecX family transcriptional regulator [Candidatus Levybacteria bacterium]|nr:RecX family transcriptional regulator [Candidatus Levybacteria bacterium]